MKSDYKRGKQINNEIEAQQHKDKTTQQSAKMEPGRRSRKDEGKDEEDESEDEQQTPRHGKKEQDKGDCEGREDEEEKERREI